MLHFNLNFRSHKFKALQRTFLRSRTTTRVQEKSIKWNPRPIKDITFAAFVCTSTFSLAAVLYKQRIETEKIHRKWLTFGYELKTSFNTTSGIISHLPSVARKCYLMMKQEWDNLPEAKKGIYCYVAVNAIVFGCWQLRLLQPLMNRYFTHSPAAGLSITQLTSTFSHQSLAHFGFNMMALTSFGTLLYSFLGREEFSAFYISSGVCASLISGLSSLRLRELALRPSLGASGAIFACVGALTVAAPKLQIALIFLPFQGTTLDNAVPVLAAIDVAGLVFGWRLFDHAVSLALNILAPT
jgi:rhomboid-like protein